MKLLSQLLAILWITGSLIACSKDEVPEPNRTPLDPNGNIQFPDANFAAYMVENFDTDGDGGISPTEAAAITAIRCSDKGIKSVAGIEYCTKLVFLDCTENQLTTLDVSKNMELIALGCNENQLTALDISKNTKLNILDCSFNELTSLDVNQNTNLDDLDCSSNQLTALDVSNNTKLIELDCDWNQLTTLDVSKNTKLTDLYCHNNQLTALDVSKNTKLKDLSCSNNQLTTLDVSKTNLGNSNYIYPLSCNMESLQTLYLKTGWKIKYINNPRDAGYIHPNTQIEYKD